MATAELFSLAPGLEEPWYVSDVKFDPSNRRLDLTIDFKRGSHFSCPECKKSDCIACASRQPVADLGTLC